MEGVRENKSSQNWFNRQGVVCYQKSKGKPLQNVFGCVRNALSCRRNVPPSTRSRRAPSQPGACAAPGFHNPPAASPGNDTPIPQNTPLCFPGNSQAEYRQEFPAGAASLALSSGRGPRLSGTPSSGLPGTSGVLFVCHSFISKQYLECSGLL